MSENKEYKKAVFKQRQSLDLESKIQMTKKRIREWYDHFDGDVYVSFSGGRDSTVLLDIVWSIYPDVPAVFSNTGLELRQIKEFVKFTSERGLTSIVNGERIYRKGEVVRVTPKENFKKVTEQYGYAVVSKKVSVQLEVLQKNDPKWANTQKLYREGVNSKGVQNKFWKLPKKYEHLIDSNIKFSGKCCDKLKKDPFKNYEKETGFKPIQGVMADEGGMRAKKLECNAFGAALEVSSPMLFWLQKDVLEYIKTRRLRIAKPYLWQKSDDGDLLNPLDRTGCSFCLLGVAQEKGKYNRFQSLYKRDRRMWDTAVNKLGVGKVLDLIDIKYLPEDENETN